MDTLQALYRLRSTLEAFALTHLRHQVDPSPTFKRLRDQLREMHACAQKGEHTSFRKADTEFHRTLVSSCAVPTLLDSWEATIRVLHSDNLRVKKTCWTNLNALHRDHVLLLEAWKSSDDTAAQQATHHHLEVAWSRFEVTSGEQQAEAGAVERVATFLSTHYPAQMDIRWVAQHIAFLSCAQLTRLFEEKLGMPPEAWLKQVRLQRAAHLLAATDVKIPGIEKLVGYKSAAQLSRDFLTKYGMSPKNYRLKHATQIKS